MYLTVWEFSKRGSLYIVNANISGQPAKEDVDGSSLD